MSIRKILSLLDLSQRPGAQRMYREMFKEVRKTLIRLIGLYNLERAVKKTEKAGIKVRGKFGMSARTMHCPFHLDTHPSGFLLFHPFTGKIWFYCFGCKKEMRFKDFYRKIRGEENGSENSSPTP